MAVNLNYPDTLLCASRFPADIRRMIEDLIINGPPHPVTGVTLRDDGDSDILVIERGIMRIKQRFICGARPTFQLISWTAADDIVYLFGISAGKNLIIPYHASKAHVKGPIREVSYNDTDEDATESIISVYSTPAYDILITKVSAIEIRTDRSEPFLRYRPIKWPFGPEDMPTIGGRDIHIKYAISLPNLYIMTMSDNAEHISIWHYMSYRNDATTYHFQSMKDYRYDYICSDMRLPYDGGSTLIGFVGMYGISARIFHSIILIDVLRIQTFTEQTTSVEIRTCRRGLWWVYVNDRRIMHCASRPAHAAVNGDKILVLVSTSQPQKACLYTYTAYDGDINIREKEIDTAGAITIRRPNNSESVPFHTAHGWVYRWGINTGLIYKCRR